MKPTRLTPVFLCAAFAACGDNKGTPAVNTCDGIENCVEIDGGDVKTLQNLANSLEPNTTIVLGAGTFAMTNSLTIRAAGAHVIGQGIDVTILDFAPTTTQVNGVDVVGDNFLIQDLTVQDSPKDGIRVEDSNGVVFRRIRATWTTPSDPTNGGYGIYPVKSQNVLVENSRAEAASDAGLYVGQCQHVIVRNNTVSGNVAGLEIENTQYADVFGNTADDNTGGILVFDLPGNPIVGHDIRLRNNTIRNNNHLNFAPGGVVGKIPVGTGTFAMASRRVEITGNTYINNGTTDIALISGLAIESDPTKWELPTASLTGDWEDLGLIPGATPNTIMNWRGENILVADNTHTGSGLHPDTSDPLMLGILLIVAYAGTPVDNVVYDSILETTFDSTDPAKNSNDNHMCVGGNTGGTFASMSLDHQTVDTIVPFFRPAAPFAPFDCTDLTGGPVAQVVLP
ncbi:MAG: hypothetical protein H6Q90_2263 [Deltaproteobacteria bacterium]|nr:hypothetical protein [Deltaproteobacteria bacterium]